MVELSKADEYKIFKIHQKARKCIKQYGLIEEGDRILIGLSGGKDSLALTEILGEKSKIFNPRFSLVAAHITITNVGYQSDLEYLESQAAQYNMPFVHHTTNFDDSTDNRKSPCFLCSWNRRKTLFEIAKAYGCNRIALGHHQDDILETLLMNMAFQGAIGTMPPKLKMDKFDMTIIRPLALNSEKEMIELAKIRQFRKQQKNCPYEKDSHRSDMKSILHRLEAMNPNARHSLWSCMNNVQQEYLPEKI